MTEHFISWIKFSFDHMKIFFLYFFHYRFPKNRLICKLKSV